jgi:endonuclease YncB( thermonuclease family)
VSSRFGFTTTLLAFVTIILAGIASAGDFKKHAQVTRVVDGDTLVVQYAGGASDRLRIIGIDTPEVGACGAASATLAAQSLAQGKHVTLLGDATQATRDRYGRLLAYVWLPGGRDLGFQLIALGLAKAFVYDRPFKRLSAYRNAEVVGRRQTSNVWSCDAVAVRPVAAVKQEPSVTRRCHASYKGACLDPNAYDYDCAGGRGNGPKYTGAVRVVGPDDFGLDGDGDGNGCE